MYVCGHFFPGPMACQVGFPVHNLILKPLQLPTQETSGHDNPLCQGAVKDPIEAGFCFGLAFKLPSRQSNPE